jgi:hypothetical protein
MRKLMKALGFLSVLATVSDVSGMVEYYLKPNTDVTISEVVSDDVVSEDYGIFSPRRPRRPRRTNTGEEKGRSDDLPQPSSSPNSTLFTDIVENRELFIHFDFGNYERDTLCAVNREVGKDSVGLLLLESSGILKSLLIDRNTLEVIHKKASIPPKEIRNELAGNGVLVPDARLIASQVAEVRERVPENTHTAAERKPPKKPRKNEALWAKVREEVKSSKNPKLSPEQSREALERFRREIQKSKSESKQKEVTEK